MIAKVENFPDPGDRDLYYGIQEINKSNYPGALKHFEKASNYKNEYASLFKAIIHYTGFGLKKGNLLKAIDLLQNVASTYDNCVAQYLLGEIFLEGEEDIPPNFTDAIHWLELSGDKGWADSNVSLANAYGTGVHAQRDLKKAVIYFEKVAKIKKSTTSIFEPPIYLFGNKNFELKFSNVNPDIVVTLERKLKSSVVSPVRCMATINKSTDSIFLEIQHIIFWLQLTNMKTNSMYLAQLSLSFTYASGGNNVPKDDEKAIYWAKQAANSGSAYACTLVAEYYEGGLDIEHDYKEAMKWHRQSLILDEYSRSSYHIGKLYFFGKGVKRNHKFALRYFELMLTFNDEDAEPYYYMGKIHEVGKYGAPLCYKEAYEYYHKAFDLGFSRGGSSIGLLYHLGLGIKKDMAKAYDWFLKSSLLDSAAGHYMLGIYYLKGHHVQKDIKKALNFFLRSHEGGYEDAVTMIAEIICL